jgi:hypothetical protein
MVDQKPWATIWLSDKEMLIEIEIFRWWYLTSTTAEIQKKSMPGRIFSLFGGN